jgi:hypothetical protein
MNDKAKSRPANVYAHPKQEPHSLNSLRSAFIGRESRNSVFYFPTQEQAKKENDRQESFKAPVDFTKV